MPMIVDDVKEYVAERAWGARDLASIEDATVRLHWTDQPYRWHVNQTSEVFVVLDGVVDMLFMDDGVEASVRLEPGDIFVAHPGDAHVAHPIGQARVLVVEQKGAE